MEYETPWSENYRVLKGGGCPRGGGNWENPKDSGREDWGTLGESPPAP